MCQSTVQHQSTYKGLPNDVVSTVAIIAYQNSNVLLSCPFSEGRRHWYIYPCTNSTLFPYKHARFCPKSDLFFTSDQPVCNFPCTERPLSVKIHYLAINMYVCSAYEYTYYAQYLTVDNIEYCEIFRVRSRLRSLLLFALVLAWCVAQKELWLLVEDSDLYSSY